MSETFTSGSAWPLSSRVEKINVDAGPSLTVSPMFVTWTTVDVTRGWLAVKPSGAVGPRFAPGMPSTGRIAAHTRPVPFGDSALVRSNPYDCIASGVTLSVRRTPLPAGRATKLAIVNARSRAIRFAGEIGAIHC